MASYYLGDTFKVSSPFGDTAGRGTSHNALDLAAPSGTPIPSIVGGKVTEVYINNKTAGNGITIQGADGREYRYIHMKDAPIFKVGDTISSGAVVGHVGSTGNSTGPHLDLRVKENGKYVDPMTILKGGASSVPLNSGGYNNYTKLQQAAGSDYYANFKKLLTKAVTSGAIPDSWAVPLAELIGRESSWNHQAKNKSSSAFGYGQFLDSTRKSYEKAMGMTYGNPYNQILMTAQYIKDRYGSPIEALNHWDSKGFY